MFRRFSAADLEDLRRWELRRENDDFDNGAQSMLDYADDDEEIEPPIVAVALDLSKIQLEAAHRKATSFETLPIFQRSRVFVEGDGNFTIRRRSPDLDISTDTVPIYLNDSVNNISGVKIPLLPQRAMSSDSLAEDEERPAPPPRRLPAWKPPPNHGKHSNILTDEALVMRTNAARNAQRMQEGAATTSPTRSIRDAITSFLKKPAPNTWIGKMSQSQYLAGSELNLAVMAWEDSEGHEVMLPATASEHLRVVSVKGDHSPVIRKRRPSGSKNVRILPNPQRVEATWAPWEYDRRPPLHNGFTLQQLIDMRNEMIAYKVKEMQVHPASRTNTHIYRKENFGIK